MKYYLSFLFFACGWSSLLFAQPTDSLQIINPGLSASVVPYRRIEIGFFNRLSTEKSLFQFDSISETSRYSSLYHVLQAGYGVLKNNRLNVGASFIFAHTRGDADETRGAFAVLKGADANATVFREPAAVGIYARGVLFRRLPELTAQAGVFFPATRSLPARQSSGYDRTLVQIQFSFYQQFRPWFYLFATAETDVLFANINRKQTSVLLPLNLYPVFRLGYYSKTYLFGSLGYNGSISKVSPGLLKGNGYRVQYGLGVQRYFTPSFSAYAQWQAPLVIETKSVTTEVLKKGAFALSLGVRWVISHG